MGFIYSYLLPWDIKFVLTLLGQTVVYREYEKFTEIYTRIRRYPGVSIPPGRDTENYPWWDLLVKWSSPTDYIALCLQPERLVGYCNICEQTCRHGYTSLVTSVC